jgi:hypothetical protein
MQNFKIINNWSTIIVFIFITIKKEDFIHRLINHLILYNLFLSLFFSIKYNYARIGKNIHKTTIFYKNL